MKNVIGAKHKDVISILLQSDSLAFLSSSSTRSGVPRFSFVFSILSIQDGVDLSKAKTNAYSIKAEKTRNILKIK